MTNANTTPNLSRVDWIRHAADKMEQFGRELLETTNPQSEWNNPKWTDEANAKAEYDDCMETARQLRELVAEVISTGNNETQQ